jgi:copper oxidase (laccase) domain-containing protein
VGPGICRECYEVGQDVADAFIASYTKGQLGGVLFDGVQEGKYQLDLWRANVVNLLEAGVPEDNIQVTDICTCCNADFLFSHRASKGSRGGLCGFLEIRDL